MEDNLLSLNCELQETNKKLQEAYRWMRDSRDLLRKSRYEEGLAFLVDREGQIEWISEKVLEYTGKPRNELIASNIMDLIHLSCRNHLEQALKQAWIGSINPIKVEITFVRAEERLFEAKISRLTSSEQRRLLVLLECYSPNSGERNDTGRKPSHPLKIS
jgi:PAS domain-containing protein